MPQTPKPRWVTLTQIAIAASIAAPVLLGAIFHHHWRQFQLALGVIVCAWVFVCGFFTAFNPLPIARYFARPGTHNLMLHDKHPLFTRVYFAIAGTVMMLIALAVGGMFFLLRNAPPAGAR